MDRPRAEPSSAAPKPGDEIRPQRRRQAAEQNAVEERRQHLELAAEREHYLQDHLQYLFPIRELELYGPLVTEGSYLVAHDGAQALAAVTWQDLDERWAAKFRKTSSSEGAAPSTVDAYLVFKQVDGAWLIVVATDDAETNKTVGQWADELGLECNRADNVDAGTFAVPAIMDNDEGWQLAILGGEAGPLFSTWMKGSSAL